MDVIWTFGHFRISKIQQWHGNITTFVRRQKMKYLLFYEDENDEENNVAAFSFQAYSHSFSVEEKL